MSLSLSAYRSSPRERARIEDLFRLAPATGVRALDVGTRDGYLARMLAERYQEVVALDLDQPSIDHPRIWSIRGNAADMGFADRSFDLVLCAEVLEHIPPDLLPVVCHEICRVSRGVVVIGVPYRQDLRCGQTTCSACGALNPPWGHVNSFDESRLMELFKGARLESVSFVGSTRERTNAISTTLMNFAGNPFGTWDQDEACVYCGESIGRPKERTPLQRVATRVATILNRIQEKSLRPRGNWIHALFPRRFSYN